MSKYTIEIDELLKEGVEIFDFDYNFYTDDEEIRKAWEQKFLDKYRFYEIGFPTVYKFKHYLKEKLNRIAPYYIQIYETELKSKDIEFLLNKDLKEEFIRDVEGNVEVNDTISSTSTDNALSKGSNIANGNAKVSLEDGYLTSIDDSNIQSTNEGSSQSLTDNTMKETTTLISRGNIGVTSSAQLLKEWRQVLINIDELVIDECQDLFMGVM